jgi:hypothetical protein
MSVTEVLRELQTFSRFGKNLPKLSQEQAEKAGVFPATAELLPSRFWQQQRGQTPETKPRTKEKAWWKLW